MSADYRTEETTRPRPVLPRAVYTARPADRRGRAVATLPAGPLATSALLNI